MATFHIGSFDQTTALNLPGGGKIIALNANPFNSNMCVAYDDINFSNWGAQSTKVQQVRVPGTGNYIAVMPNGSSGIPTFYGFVSLADLLNNARFVPDLGGGSLSSGAFSTANDVATALSSIGGMLIDPVGTPTIN